MQARKNFTRLILCVTLVMSQQLYADSYCPVTDDGKIWIDQCIYSSNEECRQATGTKGNCVRDQVSSTGTAPYCMIMGAFEVCDKYQDYESCVQDAKKQAGQCIKNSNYQGDDK